MRPLLLILGLWLPLQAGNPITMVLTGNDFHASLAAIGALPGNLDGADQAHLLQWLVKPNGLPGEAVLKNDLINVLRNQKQVSPELAKTLAAMYRDHHQPVVLRDYALQHLGLMQGDEPSYRDLFWQATHESGSSVAGTALLALMRNKADGALLASRALALAEDENASEFSRIPALRVCGALELARSAVVSRQLAQNGSNSLRLAAIATLGEVGHADDLTFLQNLMTHENARLFPAIQRSLQLLETQTGEGRNWL